MDIIKIEDLNDIIRGYLIRACKEAEYSSEQMWKIYGAINLAFDDMTMEDARKEWQNYINGDISFIKTDNEE